MDGRRGVLSRDMLQWCRRYGAVLEGAGGRTVNVGAKGEFVAAAVCSVPLPHHANNTLW